MLDTHLFYKTDLFIPILVDFSLFSFEAVWVDMLAFFCDEKTELIGVALWEGGEGMEILLDI